MGQFFKMVLAVMLGYFICVIASVACLFIFSAVTGGVILNQLSNVNYPTDSIYR